MARGVRPATEPLDALVADSPSSAPPLPGPTPHRTLFLHERALAAIFLPIALSSLLITAGEQVIVVSGLSRLSEARTSLAAYGIALALSIVVEAPVMMMMTTSVTLVRDARSYVLVRRFAFLMGVAFTVFNVLVYWTPLYDLVVVPLLRLPADVAAAAHLPLRIMVLWPLVVSVRKFYQGVLVRVRATRMIGYGTVLRLGMAAIVMYGGAVWLHPPGALLGGIALISGMILETLFITIIAMPVARSTVVSAAHLPVPVTYGGVWRFYAPLVVTSGIRVLLQPLITAGLARSAAPEISLAAWPVAFGLLTLVSSPTMAMQEVAITFRQSSEELRAVRRCGTAVGVALFWCVLTLAVTPLAGVYFRGLLGVPPDVATLALVTLAPLLALPMLYTIQALLRATLADRGQTGAVRSASVTNMMIVAACLLVGVLLARIPGAIVAGTGMTVGLLAEDILLWRSSRATRGPHRAVYWRRQKGDTGT